MTTVKDPQHRKELAAADATDEAIEESGWNLLNEGGDELGEAVKEPSHAERLKGRHLIATSEPAAPTGTERTPGHWRNDPKAKVVNYGSGKLQATSTNFGAAVGLSQEQTATILDASRQMGANRESLARQFHTLDTGEGELTPEANAVAEQIAAADRAAKVGAQIRAAMVAGDRQRLQSLLFEAGLPYGAWL